MAVNSDTDFANSHELRLCHIISNNVLMVLNYLVSMNLDYEQSGYPGIHRDIRNSIEAYYDLFNLISDPDNYANLLKISNKVRLPHEEYKQLSNQVNRVYEQYKGRNSYYSIVAKGNIAAEIL